MVVHLVFTRKSSPTFSCEKYENAQKGDIYTFAHKIVKYFFTANNLERAG